MPNQYGQLDGKQREIYNILTGKTLFPKPILNQSIFNTDLVIKLKLSKTQYINKNQFVPLSRFIYNPSIDLQQAYRVAYQKLIIQSQYKNQNKNSKTIKIKNQVNFIQNKINQYEQYQNQQHYQVQLGNDNRTDIIFPCYVQCKSNEIDFFTLKYNTLIYVLQKNCGFQVKSYIVQQKQGQLSQSYIYILLAQNIKNLLKAADRFKIKKQIDYSQIDLFLNQPVDNLGRPFHNNADLINDKVLHSQLLNKLKQKIQQKQNEKNKNINNNNKNLVNQTSEYARARKDSATNQLLINLKLQDKTNRQNTQNNIKDAKSKLLKNSNIFLNKSKPKQTRLQNQQSAMNQNDIKPIIESMHKLSSYLKQNQLLQLYKRVNRNMNNKHYSLNEMVIDQRILSQNQKLKISNYLLQFFYKFNSILQENIQLSSQQKNYIYSVNRRKNNIKCEKQYILKLKRKKVFQMMKQQSYKNNFRVHDIPIAFFPFILPSKRLSFIQRLRGIFLYEQYKVTPYGDLSLFCKMDRIKIAYLTLNQNIRVNNLNSIQASIFAIHDDFQRFGIIQQALVQKKIDQNIKGGINGKNLLQQWNPLTPWKSNIITLRNYFGQDTVYQLYLKNHLILYFMIIIPLHTIGLLSYFLFIVDETIQNDAGIKYKQSLIYNIIFFSLTIGFFAYFLQKWKCKQQQFQQNFIQSQQRKTFRYQYKGPYVRNTLSDSMNQHKSNPNIITNISKFLNFIFIFVLLGAECGIFYGIRMLIVQLSQIIPNNNARILEWPHIIGYSIFFIFNSIIYEFVFRKLSQYLTKLQNLPTQQMHKNSIKNKNFLFLIGIQLIPIIFLLIIQPFAHTSCYSSLCYDQLQQYIKSRYFIVFYVLAFKLCVFIFMYVKSQIAQNQRKINLDPQLTDFDKKLANYIDFIRKQSLKPLFKSHLNDQTLSLLHYGLFATIFSISPFLGLANMILQYSIQRIQLLIQAQRPICKSLSIQNFTQKYVVIMHLSIFVNNWVTFYTMAEVQYNLQVIVMRVFSNQPTFEGILIFKIITILIVILFFQFQVLLIRHFVSENSIKTINNRKKRKFQKHIMSKNYMKTTKPIIKTQKIHPFKTIFRTKPYQLMENYKKQNKYQSQQTQDEKAQLIKSMKNNLKNKIK